MSRDSRFLSLILRHAPERIGLQLDKNGWVSIANLLRALKRSGRPLTRAQLDEIVTTSDKQRFTLSDDGLSIRAAQGHSIDVDLGLPPAEPPEVLYHGTARANLDQIFNEGLLPRRRRHVHLSLDPETAEAVGRRHGKPTVLRVDAGRMHRDGHVFFLAENGVWLTEKVPAAYLAFGIA